MSKPVLGIIGGGQLGSLLATAAKKIGIKTVIFCDDQDAPAQNFSDKFIYGKYDDQNIIYEFINAIDIATYEFENIPYETLNKINTIKSVLPNPSINKIVQNRLFEKDYINTGMDDINCYNDIIGGDQIDCNYNCEIDYSSQIQPIFNSYCIECHNNYHPYSLSLSSYQSLMIDHL